jgi:hypothetical protein
MGGAPLTRGEKPVLPPPLPPTLAGSQRASRPAQGKQRGVWKCEWSNAQRPLLAELHGAGLVHKIAEGFVFATRPASRYTEVIGGPVV